MIKDLAKGVSRIGANFIDQHKLIRLTGQHLILPFYHAVSDDVPIHLKNLYTPRSVKGFKNDLEFLLKHYEPIALDQLIELKTNGKAITKKFFHITFDDGLSEFYDFAAPILKEKGIPATVFLNTGFIDNKELFYRFKVSILVEKIFARGLLDISQFEVETLDELAQDNDIDFDGYLKKEQPYLTSDQIKELIKQGFTFGAHSIDHPLYKNISFEDQLQQTKISLENVVTKFKLDYRVFSFPFTDDGVTMHFFKEIGKMVDLTFGSAGLKKETIPSHFQRIPMEEEFNAEHILKSAYFYYLLKSFVGKNKISRD